MTRTRNAGLIVTMIVLCASTPVSARQSPSMRAEIRGARALWADVRSADRPLDVSAWKLTDGHGREIAIESVLPNTASETLVVPFDEIDPTRVYFLELPAQNLRALARRDPWFRTLHSTKPLGAVVSADRSVTTFRLFAPRAFRVRLFVYFAADDAPEKAARIVEMTRDRDGVWEAEEPGDHHGLFYDFTVHGADDPGDRFFDTHRVHVSDPYARVSMDSYGKSRVWRTETPPRPVRGGRPRMEDVVAYEVHVQDFADLLPVRFEATGTFEGMATPGLVNRRGRKIGFDHIVDLGVNVVHLMPVQEFLHYPDADWQADMASDPYAKAMAIDRENYDWGYRTTHPFAIETRFRTRDAEPGAERSQFKALVEAFHDRGIAVIVDLVPNHTGENMDARDLVFTFNGIDKDYYYRTDDSLAHIGPFGNEVKTENRPMVQRWLVDQMRALVDELGVDGFRIDLAGQIDQQTLLWAKTELPADLIIYGEPWIAISDPAVSANPDWSWYKADAPITYFQDDTRNAIQGSPFDVKDVGFAGGRTDLRDRVKLAVTNGFEEEGDPNRGIGYIDIHDNWTLADRYALAEHNGLKGVDEEAYRLAAGLLLTTLGPVVLHGGSELLRSKGLAPDSAFVRDVAGGPIWFKGREDTYNVRSPNHFDWEKVGATPVDGPNDIAAMHAWWRGLIQLRRSSAGAVLRVGTRPAEDYVRFILPQNPSALAYVIGGRLIVAVNASGEPVEFTGLDLPPGDWKLVADGRRVDPKGAFDDPDARLGADRTALTVPPRLLRIWVPADPAR